MLLMGKNECKLECIAKKLLLLQMLCQGLLQRTIKHPTMTMGHSTKKHKLILLPQFNQSPTNFTLLCAKKIPSLKTRHEKSTTNENFGVNRFSVRIISMCFTMRLFMFTYL